MTDITGSSVVILEVAEFFLKIGYEVHVGCVKLDFPMAGILQQSGIVGFVIQEIISPEYYEFIWCQHITFGIIDIEKYVGQRLPSKVIFCHLGPSVPLEMPSYPYEKYLADLILCNSAETKDAIVHMQGETGKEIVFHNASPSIFMEAPRRDRFELVRVLLVSNHHVPELNDAAAFMREYHKLHVEFLGVNTGVYRRVDPVDFAWADTIVTIGKTVVYGLLGGVPVYVYGPHGGDGYLKQENYERNKYHNFSGRPGCLKKDGKEIAEEIVNGWPESLDFTLQRQLKFGEDYCLEKVIPAILEALTSNAAAQVNPEWILTHRLYRNIVRSLSIA